MALNERDMQTSYLTFAAADRAAAEGEVLANVRTKYLASAARWDWLARLAALTGDAREARLDLAHR